MTSLSFDSITGTGSVNIDETRKFVEAWFDMGDIALITALKHSGAGMPSLSQAIRVPTLWSQSNEDLEAVGVCDDSLYGVYVGINPLIEDHAVELRTRGGKKDVKRINGLVIDFDVKPGCFGSREEIFEFLTSLDIQPTIVVNNGGSGGAHAYWKLQHGETASEDLLVRWWSYIQDKAGSRAVDRLIDTSRVMRLPGTIYWPKDGGLKGSVTVQNVSGVRYTVKELEEASAQAYASMEARKRETRSLNNSSRDMTASMLQQALSNRGNLWSQKIAMMKLESKIDNLDWAEILEPVGWTFLRTQGDGVRTWARPGQGAKSASTDFNGSSVMSLHSWSEDTGLADLKEAGIPLTKFTVLSRLGYQDDVSRMVEDLVSVI